MEGWHCVSGVEGLWGYTIILKWTKPNQTFQSLDTGVLPLIDLPVSCEENIVRKAVARPEKQTAIEKHQSRMVLSWVDYWY